MRQLTLVAAVALLLVCTAMPAHAGAPLRDLSGSTSTSDTSEVLDEVVSSGRLTSG